MEERFKVLGVDGESTVKMDRKQTGFKGVDWVRMAGDTVQLCILLMFQKGRNYLDQLSDNQPLSCSQPLTH
jgi:hypothetical protein